MEPGDGEADRIAQVAQDVRRLDLAQLEHHPLDLLLEAWPFPVNRCLTVVAVKASRGMPGLGDGEAEDASEVGHLEADFGKRGVVNRSSTATTVGRVSSSTLTQAQVAVGQPGRSSAPHPSAA